MDFLIFVFMITQLSVLLFLKSSFFGFDWPILIKKWNLKSIDVSVLVCFEQAVTEADVNIRTYAGHLEPLKSDCPLFHSFLSGIITFLSFQCGFLK